MRWKQFLTPVKSMKTEQARTYINDHKEGTFTLLDVRQPKEYEQHHLPGAKLIPLPELENALTRIDPEKPTVVY